MTVIHCVEAKAIVALFATSVLLLMIFEGNVRREVLRALVTLKQFLLRVLGPDVTEKILFVGFLDLMETISEGAVHDIL